MGVRGLGGIAVLVGLLLAGQASAACYADYKAKQDEPLRLHYGVIELPEAACTGGTDPAAAVSERIAPDGWILLSVLGLFGSEGLEARRGDAGEYFLRY
jgi:hypothetical protein